MPPKTSPFQLEARALRRAEEFRRAKSTSVLAVLFTDIARSTELREQLGEGPYEKIRLQHDRLLEDIVSHDGGGVLLKSLGDGALAVFAEPSLAVERSLGMQKALRRHTHFAERIGIDLGQVSLETQGGLVKDAFGRHVNRAARIQALAEPQHVLVSFLVYDCAVGWLRGPGVQWANHGLVSLKGFAEKMWIHEPFNPRSTTPQFLGSQSGQGMRAQASRTRGAVVRTRGTRWSSPADNRSPADPPLPQEIFELRNGFGLDGQPGVADSPLGRSPAITAGKTRSPWFFPEIVWSADPQEHYFRAIRKTVETNASPVEILWMDDSQLPANWRSILESAGCRVSIVHTTREAQEALEARRYAIVISNIALEGDPTAGLDLLGWISRRGLAIPAAVFASVEDILRSGSSASDLGAIRCTPGGISLLDAVLSGLCASLGARVDLNKLSGL